MPLLGGGHGSPPGSPGGPDGLPPRELVGFGSARQRWRAARALHGCGRPTYVTSSII